MDAKYIVTINLMEYGVAGIIEMCYPSFRQLNETKNYASRQMKLHKEDTLSVNNLAEGDFDIMTVMAYVRKAPFERNVESFLDFCDNVDSVCLGASYDLFERMQKAIETIDEVGSPFANSRKAETPTSE